MSRPPIHVPHPHVCCDSNKFNGSPHVADTGVLVRRLWAWHRAGTSVEALLRRYPRLGPARVLDALAFAWDNQELVEDDLAREQRMIAAERSPAVGLQPMRQQLLPFPVREETMRRRAS